MSRIPRVSGKSTNHFGRTHFNTDLKEIALLKAPQIRSLKKRPKTKANKPHRTSHGKRESAKTDIRVKPKEKTLR